MCVCIPAGLVKPTRDWKNLGPCLKVIQHMKEGGMYYGVAVNSKGLLAVTDSTNNCVHLLTKEGALVRSIGEGVLSHNLFGVAFDLKGNVWVCDWGNNKVCKLSQDGRLLQSILHVADEWDYFNCPVDVSVSPKGLIYVIDNGNHRVTVHDEGGKFLFTFGSHNSGLHFEQPHGMTFASDGLVYVTDGDAGVNVWCKEGNFQRNFKTKYNPTCIAATSDNHLLITSYYSHTVMVYTLDGQLVHEFGVEGSDPGRFIGPSGVCADIDGLVYVADYWNRRVQVWGLIDCR